jgi:hypothetical protein
MSNFRGARAKLTIGSLDDAKLAVEAQYNPKELMIEKPVNWSEKAEAHLEFLGIQCRTFTVELMFDCYESREQPIQNVIKTLDELCSPREFGSRYEKKQRPHHCIALWGDKTDGMPKMRCVITNLQTKYVMWDEDGMPLRAICTVQLKEMRTGEDELKKLGAEQIQFAAAQESQRVNDQKRLETYQATDGEEDKLAISRGHARDLAGDN